MNIEHMWIYIYIYIVFLSPSLSLNFWWLLVVIIITSHNPNCSQVRLLSRLSRGIAWLWPAQKNHFFNVTMSLKPSKDYSTNTVSANYLEVPSDMMWVISISHLLT